jgi:hypothetical protein
MNRDSSNRAQKRDLGNILQARCRRATHMRRYLAEFELRYSAKDKTVGDRAAEILKGMENRRLTYRRISGLAA